MRAGDMTEKLQPRARISPVGYRRPGRSPACGSGKIADSVTPLALAHQTAIEEHSTAAGEKPERHSCWNVL